MFKNLLALTVTVLIGAPVLAQGWADSSAGDAGARHHSNDWKPSTLNDYRQVSIPGRINQAPTGQSDMTRINGVFQPGNINGPMLDGTSPMGFTARGAFSGASTAAPLVLPNISRRGFGSRVTDYVPGSFAARQMGRTTLPETRLDSFVYQSGYNDLIYGDEGTDGPPPYEVFDEAHRIERGIWQGDLTTGHKSDAPDAWGWPQ